MPYGLDDDEWIDAKTQIRAILEEVAGATGLIEYGKLSERIDGVEVHPHHGGTMSHLLAEIQDEDHEAKEPLLPALVVLKATKQPSDGFWLKAESLGCTVGDRTDFWVRECGRCYVRYGARS